MAEDDALNSWGFGTSGVEQEPEEEKEPKIGKYSTASVSTSRDHALLVDWLKEAGNVSSGTASDFANELAETWRRRNGHWPSAGQLMTDDSTAAKLSWVSSGMYALPGTFGVRNRDGSISYYNNNPESGLTEIHRLEPGAGPGRRSEVVDQLDPEAQIAMTGGFMSTLASSTRVRTDLNYPVFTEDEIGSLLTSVSGSGGGGGGGGGTRRQDPLWDREKLADRAREVWRGRLLDEPDDRYGIVDQYISEATSFFHRGGNLDFDTFVLRQAEQTPRHRMLYEKKPDTVSHDQYLGERVNAVRALGLRESTVERETIAGMSTGASVQGFTERVQKIGESVAANQGGFSRQFASTLAGMGVQGT